MCWCPSVLLKSDFQFQEKVTGRQIMHVKSKDCVDVGEKLESNSISLRHLAPMQDQTHSMSWCTTSWMSKKKKMSMLLISHLIWSAAFKLLDHSWKPRSYHQRRPSQVAVWSPCKFEVHGEITGCTRHVVKEKTSREWSKNSSYAGSCLDITEKMMLNERSEMFKSGRVFNYYGPDLRAFWSHAYSILKWLLCMSQKR